MKTRDRVWIVAATVIVVAALSAGALWAGQYAPRPQGRGEAPWPSPAVSAPTVAVPAVVVAPDGGLPGEGELLVPEQVQPGTYQSAGPSGSLPSCYVVVRDAQGSSMGMPRVGKGSVVAVIPEGASQVEISGCQPFTRVR